MCQPFSGHLHMDCVNRLLTDRGVDAGDRRSWAPLRALSAKLGCDCCCQGISALAHRRRRCTSFMLPEQDVLVSVATVSQTV